MIREVEVCPKCDYEYSHILGVLRVDSDDRYRARRVTIDGDVGIETDVFYGFRTQGNAHILFTCENGHFYIKSYDGHKGKIYPDQNNLMKNLEIYLNDNFYKEFEEDGVILTMCDEMVDAIARFLAKEAEIEKEMQKRRELQRG